MCLLLTLFIIEGVPWSKMMLSRSYDNTVSQSIVLQTGKTIPFVKHAILVRKNCRVLMWRWSDVEHLVRLGWLVFMSDIINKCVTPFPSYYKNCINNKKKSPAYWSHLWVSRVQKPQNRRSHQHLRKQPVNINSPSTPDTTCCCPCCQVTCWRTTCCRPSCHGHPCCGSCCCGHTCGRSCQC